MADATDMGGATATATGLTPIQELKLALLQFMGKLAKDASVEEILRLLQAHLPSAWAEGIELLLPGGALHGVMGYPPEWFTNITVGIESYAPHQPCHVCLGSKGQTLESVKEARLCAGCKYSCFHPGCQAEGWPDHKEMCKLLRKNPDRAAALRSLQHDAGVYTDGKHWYGMTGRHSADVRELVKNWCAAKSFELLCAKMGKPTLRAGPCPVGKNTVFAVLSEKVEPPGVLHFGLDQAGTDAHSSRSAYYLLHPVTAKPLVAFLAAKGCKRFYDPAAGKGLFEFVLQNFAGVPAEAIRCTDLDPEPGYYPVEKADACDPAQYSGVDWATTVLVLLWLEFPGMPPYAARLIRLAHAMGVKYILLGAEEPGCAMSPKAHAAIDELYPKAEAIPGVPDFTVSALTLANLIFISGDRPEHVRHIPLAYANDPSFRGVNQSLQFRTRA